VELDKEMIEEMKGYVVDKMGDKEDTSVPNRDEEGERPRADEEGECRLGDEEKDRVKEGVAVEG
jgi:hypothetical protein